MRRSNSASHIPRPPAARTSRVSVDEPPKKKSIGTAPPIRKTAATPSGPPALRRTLSNLKKTTPMSSTQMSTPLWANSGVKRSTISLKTPSSARSRSKSPYKSQTKDKAWQRTQLIKVRDFLKDHPSASEDLWEKLKSPISIPVFIEIINLLFKECSSIVVNAANYKEVVLNVLKLWDYPGNISTTLLKTVNTMHNFDQVINILAWLVDLVTAIKTDCHDDSLEYRKIECVTDFVYQKYFAFNSNVGNDEEIDREFSRNLEILLEVKNEDLERLENEVECVTNKDKDYENVAKNLESEYAEMEQMIKQKQEEIINFYESSEATSEDLDCEEMLLQERKDKLNKWLADMEKSICSSREILQGQPCSVEEKNEMVENIEKLKRIIEHKTDEEKVLKQVQIQHKEKLGVLEKKFYSAIHDFNMQILTLQTSGARDLYFQDTDVTHLDFLKVVEARVKKVQEFKEMIKNKTKDLKSDNEQQSSKISVQELELKSAKQALEKMEFTKDLLEKEIESCEKEIKMLMMNHEEEMKIKQSQLDEIQTNKCNVSEKIDELAKINKLRNERKIELEGLVSRTSMFFRKLNPILMINLCAVNDIRSEIVEALSNALIGFDKVQKQVLQDLEKLDQIRK